MRKATKQRKAQPAFNGDPLSASNRDPPPGGETGEPHQVSALNYSKVELFTNICLWLVTLITL